MNKALRAELLSTARRLFNERGFDGVTLREIAGALDISVGNLTYYFHTKEELVEAAVLEKQGDGGAFRPADSLEGLDDFFHRVLRYREEQAYYFQKYEELARRFQRVCEMQRQVMAEMRAMLLATLSALRAGGLLEEVTLPEQDQRTADALMAILSCAFLTEPGQKYACLWGVVHPLLTPVGRGRYRGLCWDRAEKTCGF